MEFSRTQLKLFPLLFYLYGLAAIGGALINHPLPAHSLVWSLGTVAFLGTAFFAFGYFKQFRHHKDVTLDYLGVNFLVFVLLRPIIPFAFTAWAIYAISSGNPDNLGNALMGFSIFLGSDVAEFIRMRQNGSVAES